MATQSVAVGVRRPAEQQYAQPATSLWGAYPLVTRGLYALGAVIVGVTIAGFWNYKLVDGFGRDVVAANTIGNADVLAKSFTSNGMMFGVIFAAVAGLAATFTACNCVVFAMLPGLACSTDKKASRKAALRSLGLFTLGVLVVAVAYGIYVGTLGSGVTAFNARPQRLQQAETVFTVLGVVLIAWSVLEFGFLHRITDRIPAGFRAFVSAPTTRATIMGLMVGFFAVGRPYPIFRDLLLYAASAHNPIYGAVVMSVQGLGQIAVMVAIFLLAIWLFGPRLTRWVQQKPNQPSLITAIALMVGGSYFVYYWGIALVYNLGRWGFKLGWYA
jgi:cytochrome c biogenesis protein CcdA